MEQFNIAQGIYWFCNDCHEGQWSEAYQTLCTLGYNPGALERGPDGEGRIVYDDLVAGRISLEEMVARL